MISNDIDSYNSFKDTNITLFSDSLKHNNKNPYTLFIKSKNYTWEKEGEQVISKNLT